MNPKFAIRQVTSNDHAFIYDAWWKTLRPRYFCTEGRLLRSAISERVEKALETGRDYNLVACDPDSPEVIYSVMIWREVTPTLAAIDFGYTKNSARRLGMQRVLLSTISHYKNKVMTMHAPCFTSKEFVNTQGILFGHHIKQKYDIVIDPFLYERISLTGYGEK